MEVRASLDAPPACLGRPAKEDEEGEHTALQRCYVVTATVDGSFPKIGFREDEVYEIYGSINQWQCWVPCTQKV